MIFDRVVCAALQVLRNDRPLVFVLTVLDVQDELFLKAPVVFLDPWIQMVMPALATLLADSAWQIVSDVGPLLRTV